MVKVNLIDEKLMLIRIVVIIKWQIFLELGVIVVFIIEIIEEFMSSYFLVWKIFEVDEKRGEMMVCMRVRVFGIQVWVWVLFREVLMYESFLDLSQFRVFDSWKMS